ncbi:outer membrane protein OmpA-like peptidoglycan-associated protein [Tamilnaduibacter salinus]|uniref:Outer membrane protein OmpA-like peptidoglycan-associated protein n=1 Tax=Tamilnaduibacter salinus TaxID=1484056 RepID=A0A2U1CVN1_9GAMM|nr:OmpA family protein [Tamilnaduibacter salinus]PVY75474.1 outer membrane protein OmpA-like peptidoglycan-associated protein [Tamilnaduibacter salinus]
MFQKSLAVVATGFLSLGAAQAMGSAYGAGIENSQWYHSGSVFACTLTHEVPGYGRAVFHHRAGEDLTFYLETQTRLMKTGRGELVIEAPAWRPGVDPRPLGNVTVSGERRPVHIETPQAFSMARSLLRGMAPTITQEARYSADPVRVRVSNINFGGPWQDYQSCVSGLLPVNYDQIRRSRIGFDSGGSTLTDEHRQRLDLIVQFVEADPSVERIFVDGHTDRQGNRIDNRALSEERAKVVARYLQQQGIQKDMIIQRYHGERYPAYADPRKNRRATIRLERQGETTVLQRADSGNGDGASG